MIDRALPPPVCVSYDWNPVAASSAESAVAAVLAGFVFSGIVVILSTTTRRRFEAAQALKLLLVAFLGLAVTSYLLANDAGEQTCPRADSLVVVVGGPLGTFSVLMLVSLTWLVAAYGGELEDVLKLLRGLIYVASAFVVLLLCVSSQSYVSAELGRGGWIPLWVVSDFIYGVGFLAIFVGVGVLTRNRWVRVWKRRHAAGHPATWDKRRARSPEQLNKDVNRCFVAALSYLAVVSFSAGAVIGFPRGWYHPIHATFVYTAALAALLVPVPIFALAARALAKGSKRSAPSQSYNSSATQSGSVAAQGRLSSPVPRSESELRQGADQLSTARWLF